MDKGITILYSKNCLDVDLCVRVCHDILFMLSLTGQKIHASICRPPLSCPYGTNNLPFIFRLPLSCPYGTNNLPFIFRLPLSCPYGTENHLFICRPQIWCPVGTISGSKSVNPNLFRAVRYGISKS